MRAALRLPLPSCPKNITAEGVVIGQLAALTYTGGELTPVPVITYNNMTLEVGEGKDFTVGYADNTAAGTATVALTGIGNYTGYAEVSFTIRAPKIFPRRTWPSPPSTRSPTRAASSPPCPSSPTTA